MKRFVVFDAAGTVLRQVQCPEEMGPLQAREGEGVIEIGLEIADPEAFFVVDGELVPKE